MAFKPDRSLHKEEPLPLLAENPVIAKLTSDKARIKRKLDEIELRMAIAKLERTLHSYSDKNKEWTQGRKRWSEPNTSPKYQATANLAAMKRQLQDEFVKSPALPKAVPVDEYDDIIRAALDICDGTKIEATDQAKLLAELSEARDRVGSGLAQINRILQDQIDTLSFEMSRKVLPELEARMVDVAKALLQVREAADAESDVLDRFASAGYKIDSFYFPVLYGESTRGFGSPRNPNSAISQLKAELIKRGVLK